MSNNIFQGIDSVAYIMQSNRTPQGRQQWLRVEARRMEARATEYDQGCGAEDALDAAALRREAVLYRREAEACAA